MRLALPALLLVPGARRIGAGGQQLACLVAPGPCVSKRDLRENSEAQPVLLVARLPEFHAPELTTGGRDLQVQAASVEEPVGLLFRPGSARLEDAPKRLSATKTSLDSIGNKKPAASTRTAGFLMFLNTQGLYSGGGGVCHSLVERWKNPSPSLTVLHVVLFLTCRILSHGVRIQSQPCWGVG